MTATLASSLAGPSRKTAAATAAHTPGTPSGALDFALPGELEAREPPEARGLQRDGVRLLVTYRRGDRAVHARFAEIADFLQPGDLLVANDSATIPAALGAFRSDGQVVVLHLSTPLQEGLWIMEPRTADLRATAGSLRAGERLTLPGGGAATLLAPHAGSRRLWVAQLHLPAPIMEYLSRWGRPITYAHLRGTWPLEMYQTVYARVPGSAEMPSAGRAFSHAILEQLHRRGVGFVTITLHTGVSSLEAGEPPYEEAYHVPAAAAGAINAARAARRRVIAVGTTAVRALESAADEWGRVSAARGFTDLVVTPERGVRTVDGLLSGFHEPKASHLAMLEAIAGRRHLAHAYRSAIQGRYLWHEFGDLHLIVP